MIDVDSLYHLIKNKLNGDEDIVSIEKYIYRLAQEFGISSAVRGELRDRFQNDLISDFPLKLLVNWGAKPKLGYRCVPEFNLICKAFDCTPVITLQIRDLDHDATDPLRNPKQIENGLWSFHAPFSVTSNGNTCMPGFYIIELEIYFRNAPPGHSHFYHTIIRLNIPSDSAHSGGVLEIDGDGQSVVNLHGYDLKQFSRIVLKGGKEGIINLQNSQLQPEPLKPDISKLAGDVVYEYLPKPDLDKQKRLPHFQMQSKSRVFLEKACLQHSDGRRSLLISQKQITFGRNRDNDVILRFLPASAENNDHSRYLSREHMRIEMNNDGVVISDMCIRPANYTSICGRLAGGGNQ